MDSRRCFESLAVVSLAILTSSMSLSRSLLISSLTRYGE